MGEHFGAHTAAGISHFDCDKLSAQTVKFDVALERYLSDRNRESTRFRHCIARVNAQVQQGELKFARIDMGATDVVRSGNLDHDVSAQRTLEQFPDVCEHH